MSTPTEKLIEEKLQALEDMFPAGLEEPEIAKRVDKKVRDFLRTALTDLATTVKEQYAGELREKIIHMQTQLDEGPISITSISYKTGYEAARLDAIDLFLDA